MKLTRRKIKEGNKITATFYRDTFRGLLYLNSEQEDSTEDVVKSMDFERSFRGRIMKHAESGKNPFYNMVEGLVNQKAEIVCDPINTNGKDISELICKNLTEYGRKLKAPDSLFTLEELILSIQSGENPDRIKPELEKIKRFIGNEIENRIEQLTKSIKHNNIPFSLNHDNKLVPSSRKMKWLFELLLKKAQVNQKVSILNDKLEKYWKKYNYEKLEPVIIENIEHLEIKNARSISKVVSKTVGDYHHNLRLELLKSNADEQNFGLFLKAVEQYFKKYFPVKSKHPSKEYDDTLCKDRNYSFYCSYNIVKREVNRSIINQLVAGLIQQGKLLHYFNKEGSWQKDFLNSYGLSYIQVEEAFKKSLMCSLTWGINRLNFFYYDGKVKLPKKKDITLNNDEIREYRTNCYNSIRDIKVQKHFKEKLATCFPIKINEKENQNNDTIDKLIDLVEVTRYSVAHIRHNTFHYKDKSLMKILDSIDDNKKNQKNNKESINYNVAKEFFKRDIANLAYAFCEQIRSFGILEYYPVSLLISCFDSCGLEFKLYSSQNPMIPSFSKVYKKGHNLYKSEYNHKGLNWFIEVPNNNPGLLAYKNLLQLIYYNAFLPEVKENETLITSFINSTKDWNKKEAYKARKRMKIKETNSNSNTKDNIYRYEAMPDYKGEKLNDYFEILQREQMLREKQVQEGEAEQNYYIQFIQDVVVRAFDAYLNRLDNYLVELQNPSQQRKNEVDKAIKLLISKDKGKFALKTRFQKLLEPIEDKQSNNQDASHNEEKQKDDLEPSPKEKGLLCFYLFLRLLDEKEISKLQHQFVRYRCSLKKRKMDNYDESIKQDELISKLEELEELMELVRYTIPSSLPVSLSSDAKSNYKDLLQKHFTDFFEEKNIINIDLYYQSDKQTPIPRKHMTLLVRSAPLPLYQQMFKNNYLITKEDINEYLKLSNDIEIDQNRLSELHKKLEHTKVRRKFTKESKSPYTYSLGQEKVSEVKAYEDTLIKVIKYKNLRRKLTFESLYEIFQIHVDITSRLIGFAQDWERDMFFMLLALSYGGYISCNKKTIKSIFKRNVVGSLTHGGHLVQSDYELLYELCWHEVSKDRNIQDIISDKIDIRNRIAHLNHFTQSKTDALPSLEEIINKVREMLCYDRKRQNAVTKTIKELLLKEHHILIKWKSYTNNHKYQLEMEQAKDDPIIHLKHLCIDKKRKGIVDRKAYMYEKQEVWLHQGIQEPAHDGNFLNCIDQLLKFTY